MQRADNAGGQNPGSLIGGGGGGFGASGFTTEGAAATCAGRATPLWTPGRAGLGGVSSGLGSGSSGCAAGSTTKGGGGTAT